MRLLIWLKERLYQRKGWIIVAILLFAVEFICLIGPVRWLGEEKVNFLTGEGSWTLEAQEEIVGYCQEFAPEYRSVKSIGIVATTGGKQLRSGEMRVVVTDSNDQALFFTAIPYEQLTLDTYEDISMNLNLKPRESIICQ